MEGSGAFRGGFTRGTSPGQQSYSGVQYAEPRGSPTGYGGSQRPPSGGSGYGGSQVSPGGSYGGAQLAANSSYGVSQVTSSGSYGGSQAPSSSVSYGDSHRPQSIPSYTDTPGSPTSTQGQTVPSPMQDRREVSTAIPQYTFRGSQQQVQGQGQVQGQQHQHMGADKYPHGAPSRLLHTTPAAAPLASGYAQSRPMGPSDSLPVGDTNYPQPPGGHLPTQRPPPPLYYQPPRPTAQYHHAKYSQGHPHQEQGRTNMSPPPPSPAAGQSPRPYQLKPTLHSQSPLPDNYPGSPDKQSPTSPTEKEAEVDALTSLLMQNMQAAADPDFFGELGDNNFACLLGKASRYIYMSLPYVCY